MKLTNHRGQMSRLCILYFLCSSVATLAATTQEDDFTVSESRQREQVSQEFKTLFRNKNWDQLEKRALEYRTQKLRFPSGRWKLELFYSAVESLPEGGSAPKNWSGYFATLEEWKAAKPQSVTPLIVLGSSYINYAWEARGTDYAKNVTKEGWRLFRERLVKARTLLEAADKMDVKDPQTYRELLIVAMAQGWPQSEYEDVFRKAIQAEPSYHPIYFEKATYLMPRWHGKPGDLERFAEQAVNLCPEGEAIYARIAFTQSQEIDQDRLFQEYHFSWPRIRQGFQAMQKQYPKSRWNLNTYCLMASIAGDQETARQLFEQIGENWTERIWSNEGRYLHWKHWAETKARK